MKAAGRGKQQSHVPYISTNESSAIQQLDSSSSTGLGTEQDIPYLQRSSEFVSTHDGVSDGDSQGVSKEVRQILRRARVRKIADEYGAWRVSGEHFQVFSSYSTMGGVGSAMGNSRWRHWVWIELVARIDVGRGQGHGSIELIVHIIIVIMRHGAAAVMMHVVIQ